MNGSTRAPRACSKLPGGAAFRLGLWFTVPPSYRYQPYPGNPMVAYENRLLLNVTLTSLRRPWQSNLCTLIDGRFPDNFSASAHPSISSRVDDALPLRRSWRPVPVVNNDFFVVSGTNSFAAGGTYTQDRFQVGVRLPIANSLSIGPYYLIQWVNQATGWDTNQISGISLASRVLKKSEALPSRATAHVESTPKPSTRNVKRICKKPLPSF
jgi:Protein of unknown function (DUF2490)